MVLPFVPVTAMTGTSGSGTDGDAPGSTVSSRPAAWATIRPTSPREESAFPTSLATSLPKASAASRRRHGKATTI